MTESDKARKRLCEIGRQVAINAYKKGDSLEKAMALYREQLFANDESREDVLFTLERVKRSCDRANSHLWLMGYQHDSNNFLRMTTVMANRLSRHRQVLDKVYSHVVKH